MLIGAAAGVIGSELGLSALEIFLLSLFVYAGSAQFSFATLYAGPLTTLVASIFYINLRHVIYSLALGLQAQKLRPLPRLAIGAQLTDETFLVAHGALDFRQIDKASWMIGLNCTAQISWIAGNMAGAISSGFLDLARFGANFAPEAMFLSLILLQAKKGDLGKQAIAVAAVTAIAAFAAQIAGHGDLALVVVAPLVALMASIAFGHLPEDLVLGGKGQGK